MIRLSDKRMRSIFSALQVRSQSSAAGLNNAELQARAEDGLPVITGIWWGGCKMKTDGDIYHKRHSIPHNYSHWEKEERKKKKKKKPPFPLHFNDTEWKTPIKRSSFGTAARTPVLSTRIPERQNVPEKRKPVHAQSGSGDSCEWLHHPHYHDHTLQSVMGLNNNNSIKTHRELRINILRIYGVNKGSEKLHITIYFIHVHYIHNYAFSSP